MNDYRTLEYLEEFNVAYIVLNRPELHNAFNDVMINELVMAVNQAQTNKSNRLLVFKAKGASFCAGADLNWMKSMVEYTYEQNYLDSLKLAELFEIINNCSLPTIALCHSHALGGGVGLIAACDYVLAGERAKYGLTEVRLGLLPAVISPFVISKIGESQARAYFMSGARFDAFKAMNIGLVHQVENEANFESASLKLIQEFLQAAPEASKMAKALIKTVQAETEFKKLQAQTCEIIAHKRVSAEGQEGMKSMLEKRKASWL
jgi:methylglutaconyl-CoA hydratase